jgi:hypothetical protein
MAIEVFSSLIRVFHVGFASLVTAGADVVRANR